MTRLILILGIAALLSGCSSLKFWGDSSGKGVGDGAEQQQDKVDAAADKGKLPDLPALTDTVSLKREWRVGLGAKQKPFEAILRPAVADGVVYAANRGGRVWALGAERGDRRWRSDVNAELTGGVGVGAGLVLLGTMTGELVALRADTGKEAWRTRLSSEIVAPAAARGDLVVVQTQDAKVHGLAAEDGSRRWSFEGDLPVLTLRGTATPVITGELVLVGMANGKLVALDGASGVVTWEERVAMPSGRTELERMVDLNTPVVDGDIVYAVSYQGRVGAYTRGSGRELWTRDASSHHPPALGQNQLFIVDHRDRILALRTTGGQELWVNQQLRRRVLTAPLAIGELVAVADAGGYLHLLSAADGTLVGRRRVDRNGVTVPMASDGERILVQSNGGNLTAYRIVGAAVGTVATDPE